MFNNFLYIAEEDPEEICKLPPVKGFCRALLPRWRYDAAARKCVEFNYGGCGGNANNFMTNEDCMKRCEGVSA
ncbi:U-actitoxin-Avd3q [Agrilus planipennis]|uniref:U-actitoxin-Avd3q n=1 Tax=Agrilus planipennis TaxID=224129 RepID=A0A1W4WA31_AGRPL|nr:U-actitoxin-Avd3q [Agrilus planipennis]